MAHRIPLDSVWCVTSPITARVVLLDAGERGGESPALKQSRDRKLVRAAIGGSTRAIRKLVVRLTPIIQARCSKVLLRSRFRCGRDVRQQVEDMTQEVFLALFDHDCRELTRWDPERGLSLDNFVGVIAHRQTLAVLRTGRRNPWYEEPVQDPQSGQLEARELSPDELTICRDLLTRVVAELERSLNPQAHLMFQLLILDARPLEEVRDVTGLSADAVYAWRSRLLKRVRSLAIELDDESAARREAKT